MQSWKTGGIEMICNDSFSDVVPLTAKEILKMHNHELASFGGDPGFLDEGTFEMLCSIPFQSGFGVEFYPTVFDKAAKYLEGFATHQVFCDGNKRTAVDSMCVFLNLNGYEFALYDKEQYDFVLDVANNKYPDWEQISKIIESHCRAIERKAGIDFENASNLDDFLRF